MLNILPQFVSRRYTYRQAKVEDLKEISNLLSAFYRDYDGSVSFSPEALEKLFSQDPSFSIENMYVVEKAGKILACLAVWDQFSFRRTVVEKFSSTIKKLVRFLHILRPILPLPPLPAEGAALRYVFIRMPAHTREIFML